jgi:hypothetical protein
MCGGTHRRDCDLVRNTHESEYAPVHCALAHSSSAAIAFPTEPAAPCASAFGAPGPGLRARGLVCWESISPSPSGQTAGNAPRRRPGVANAVPPSRPAADDAPLGPFAVLSSGTGGGEPEKRPPSAVTETQIGGNNSTSSRMGEDRISFRFIHGKHDQRPKKLNRRDIDPPQLSGRVGREPDAPRHTRGNQAHARRDATVPSAALKPTGYC